MIREAAAGWSPGDLAPYVRHLLACFGADRLIWGSDWPVLRLAGDYAQWFEVAGQLLPGIAQQVRDAIFGGNAARLYRLEPAYHD